LNHNKTDEIFELRIGKKSGKKSIFEFRKTYFYALQNIGTENFNS